MTDTTDRFFAVWRETGDRLQAALDEEAAQPGRHGIAALNGACTRTREVVRYVTAAYQGGGVSALPAEVTSRALADLGELLTALRAGNLASFA
ncbi:MAG TPA: hypothetical protein VGI64_05970 [Streptosporangiaceae bacterium]|jgi:hypothetical protein